MRISFFFVCGIASTGAFVFPTKSSINNNYFCNELKTRSFVAQSSRKWKKSISLHQLYTASSSSDEVFVDSQDGETLQSLFSKKCDADGLMSKEMVRKLPVIAELLSDGDLLLEEFDDIWDAAPKSSQNDSSIETINLDSFLQIYRDIDNLFEDDEEDDDVVEDIENNESLNDSVDDSMEDDLDNDEAELRNVFDTLCDTSKLVSKESLREWSEIKQLIEDEMLGEDEFDQLWSTSSNSSDELDFAAFLQFNNALDELFEFDDEMEDDENEDETDGTIMVQDDDDDDDDDVPNDMEEKELPMVYGDDLPPGVLFAELANDQLLVGKKDLKRWVELQEMLEEGDLLPIELENMFDQAPKVKGTDKMDEIGFTAFYEAIDSLFEVDDGDDDGDFETDDVDNSSQFKQSFLQLLDDVVSRNDVLPCGLESSERQANAVLDAANMLESLPSNLLVKYDGDITQEDLAGEWDMIYSSSSTMKFNQGLSGLGGSFPNGKFAGLTQKLVFTKFLSDVEYLERIEVNPGSNSFDVKVTGSWELKQSVSLFTGAATTAMRVVPDKVSYGPTTMRADHWKSLGPMNLLDITYLDEDLRIMRGTTSTDTLFIFKRKS